MKPDPNDTCCHQQSGQASAPRVRCMPEQAQCNDAKSQRHDHLNGPAWNCVGQKCAAAFLGLDQLPGSEAEKSGDARGKGAAEDAGEGLPAAFEKICQCREGEQTAITRRKHPAQQANDQNQMLLESCRPAETTMEEFASNDFDKRQKHQRGKGQRDQKILRLPEPAPPARGKTGRSGRMVSPNGRLTRHCLTPSRAARKIFNWLTTSS